MKQIGLFGDEPAEPSGNGTPKRVSRPVCNEVTKAKACLWSVLQMFLKRYPAWDAVKVAEFMCELTELRLVRRLHQVPAAIGEVREYARANASKEMLSRVKRQLFWQIGGWSAGSQGGFTRPGKDVARPTSTKPRNRQPKPSSKKAQIWERWCNKNRNGFATSGRPATIRC